MVNCSDSWSVAVPTGVYWQRNDMRYVAASATGVLPRWGEDAVEIDS
jgi:hypothetical protein